MTVCDACAIARFHGNGQGVPLSLPLPLPELGNKELRCRLLNGVEIIHLSLTMQGGQDLLVQVVQSPSTIILETHTLREPCQTKVLLHALLLDLPSKHTNAGHDAGLRPRLTGTNDSSLGDPCRGNITASHPLVPRSAIAELNKLQCLHERFAILPVELVQGG